MPVWNGQEEWSARGCALLLSLALIAALPGCSLLFESGSQETECGTWAVTLGGGGRPAAIATGADCAVFMCGTYDTAFPLAGDPAHQLADFDGASTDVFVVEFDRDGAPVWSATLSSEGDDVCRDITVGDDGETVAVVGTYSGTLRHDSQELLGPTVVSAVYAVLLRGGEVTGDPLSVNSSKDDDGRAVALRNRELVVGGQLLEPAHPGCSSSPVNAGPFLATLARDPPGECELQALEAGAEVGALAVVEAGVVVGAVGSAAQADSSAELYLVTESGVGASLQLYDSANAADRITDVAVERDAVVYAGGRFFGGVPTGRLLGESSAGGFNGVVSALDSSVQGFSLRWSLAFQSGAQGAAVDAVAVSPEGDVVFAGQQPDVTTGADPQRIVLGRADRDGTQLCTHRFAGTGDTREAVDLAVSEDGSRWVVLARYSGPWQGELPEDLDAPPASGDLALTALDPSALPLVCTE